jgi:hypothetical protein
MSSLTLPQYHILTSPYSTLLSRFDSQPPHSQNIVLVLVGQPPCPRICDATCTNSCCTNCKTSLVPVVRVSRLEELWTHDTPNLTYARLEGESKCCSCCPDEGSGSPLNEVSIVQRTQSMEKSELTGPEWNEVHRVEHRAEDAGDIRSISIDLDTKHNEKRQCTKDASHSEHRPRHVCS